MEKPLIDKINALMPPWTETECTRKHPSMPSQSMGEWQAYLEFVNAYFTNRGVEKPMIVEIGIGFGHQKRYYEEILGWDHIGVDIRADRGAPDVVGDSNDPRTKAKLLTRLDGRGVNLVYLDGGHTYEILCVDYELYAPLANNIIAIHDIVLDVFQGTAGRFWKELLVRAAKSRVQDRTYMTLTGYYTVIHEHEYSFGQGTGLILIEDKA